VGRIFDIYILYACPAYQRASGRQAFLLLYPLNTSPQEKGGTMITAPIVARVIIFSSVVIIFVLIPSLCSHHYHRTGRCYVIA